MKKLISLLLLLMVSVLAFAQDKIYTRLQKNPIEGEVVEVTTTEVKYKPADRPLPIISIDKQDVVKIVYKNGQVFTISNPLKDFTMYYDQRRWNLKINAFSPLRGHTQFFLEHAKKPGRSVEYELNLIGLGREQRLNDFDIYNPDLKEAAAGVGTGIGVRFIRMPDYVNGQTRLRHLMQGSYIKPAISVAVYGRNFFAPANPQNPVDHTERKTVFAVNPNITIGRQWILDNTVSLEIYGLIGYSFDNIRSHEKTVIGDNGINAYSFDFIPFSAYGYTRFGRSDFGLSMGAGLRVGFLFNTKKDKELNNKNDK